MERYIKIHKGTERGLFSFVTESIFQLTTLPSEDTVFYSDVASLEGYSVEDLWNNIFLQDKKDFLDYRDLYRDIDHFAADIPDWFGDISLDFRARAQEVIKKHFVLCPRINKIIKDYDTVDWSKCIGVHRRATDMTLHFPTPPIEDFFNKIEECDFNSLFVLCDNKSDYNRFLNRYSSKVIEFDSIASETDLPAFRVSIANIDHVDRICAGASLLSQTSMFIGSKSNISSFVVLNNPNLPFYRL